MFFYVFESRKWIETEKIYPHDIVLILNPEKKEIYRWNGPKSILKIKSDAENYIAEMIKKFPQFKLIKLEKEIPEDVQMELDRILDKTYETKQIFDRNPSYNVFIYLCYMIFCLLGISYSFILFPFGWKPLSEDPKVLTVNVTDFRLWNNVVLIIVFITIIIFVILLISAIFTLKIFLISSAAVGVGIQTGTYFFLKLGVFLFDFQGNSLQFPPYQILLNDITIFGVLNIFGIIITLVPLIISVKAIYSQSIKISFKNWVDKKKAERKIFAVKKVSIITKNSQFTPFDPNDPDKIYSKEDIRKLNEK